MSNINIRLEGVDKLKLNLSSEKYRVKANNIVRKNAANLQDKIKTNMSQVYTGHWEGKRFVKPTGATSRSVTIQIIDGGLTAKVGPHTKYAPYLEFGTRFMSKRPAIIPALQTITPLFLQDLKELIDK